MRSIPLGKRVSMAREKRGWSQRELAEASGVSRNTISKLECDGDPKVSTLIAVSDAMRVEPSVLFVADEYFLHWRYKVKDLP